MTRNEKVFFAFAIAVLLLIALVCNLRPNTLFFGAAWIPWVIGAAIAWAIGKFLDELLPATRSKTQ